MQNGDGESVVETDHEGIISNDGKCMYLMLIRYKQWRISVRPMVSPDQFSRKLKE